MNQYIPLILSGVLLNSLAQLCIKQAMRVIGPFAFTLENLLPIGLKVIVNPFLILGMACYALSIFLWLLVLSRVDVGYAYPMLSVGYIVTAVAGRALFGEMLGISRLSGILFICLGVFLITRSG